MPRHRSQATPVGHFHQRLGPHGDKRRDDGFSQPRKPLMRGRPRAWSPRARRYAPHPPATRPVLLPPAPDPSGIEPEDRLARGVFHLAPGPAAPTLPSPPPPRPPPPPPTPH